MQRATLVQKRTLTVLVITQIVGTVGVGVAPSIGALLAGEVTDNEAWAGLARTASTLGAALLGLPLGNLPSVIFSPPPGRVTDLHVCVVDGVVDASSGGLGSAGSGDSGGAFLGRVAA